MSQNKALRYCFTINNYTDDEYTRLCEKLRAISKYFIIGKEVGEQGTPHLQGYCILKVRTRITTLKSQLSERAHFETSRGTPDSNRVYCSKEGSFLEEGDCPPPGAREHKSKQDRDTLATCFRDALRDRGRLGLEQFANDYPGCYGFSGHTLFRNTVAIAGAQARPNICVEWIYGAPGVGKSRRAHDELPSAYIKDPRTKWWNGYCLETTVIIDDFGPNGIDINHLLRWFDRYKCYVEIKGDMCPLLADKFIVTSNFHPMQVFTDNMGVVHVQYPALERRIVITEML